MEKPDLLKTLSPSLLEQYDLGDDRPRIVEALEHLSEALAAEQRITAAGLGRILPYVNRQLGHLSALTADRRRYPEIADVQILKPIFLTGAARSGTTLLHSMLAQDPQFRAPLTWEIEFPSPPPQGEHLFDDPRIEAWRQQQLSAQASLASDIRNAELKKKHLMDAVLPEECGRMLGAMLRSPSGFWTLVGLWPYYRWVVDTQMAAAYRHHRRWLQHLQWRAARSHWLLKYPTHLSALEKLTVVYPDALIVQTHRDPTETVSSLASLMATLRKGALEPEDPAALGQEMLKEQAEGLERAMAFRSARGPGAIHDVSYTALMADPLSEVGRLYRRLGLRLTAEAEQRMAQFIRDNPQAKHGKHDHRLADYGLTADQVRDRMKSYLNAFEALAA